jgi:hypothetical protein
VCRGTAQASHTPCHHCTAAAATAAIQRHAVGAYRLACRPPARLLCAVCSYSCELCGCLHGWLLVRHQCLPRDADGGLGWVLLAAQWMLGSHEVGAPCSHLGCHAGSIALLPDRHPVWCAVMSLALLVVCAVHLQLLGAQLATPQHPHRLPHHTLQCLSPVSVASIRSTCTDVNSVARKHLCQEQQVAKVSRGCQQV